MRCESLKKAQKVYRKKGRQYHFFVNEHDDDILEYLEAQENVTAKIKELIRADIKS